MNPEQKAELSEWLAQNVMGMRISQANPRKIPCWVKGKLPEEFCYAVSDYSPPDNIGQAIECAETMRPDFVWLIEGDWDTDGFRSRMKSRKRRGDDGYGASMDSPAEALSIAVARAAGNT